MDNAVLKKVQQAELYMLISFDKVCREKGLTYFLDSGTALGAVRHGGFIPWDDDIDVGMPRKDYDLFLQLGQELLPNDIFIQTSSTEFGYTRNAAKLRLEGTQFQESDGNKYEHNGIFIDIFPFDNVPRVKLFALIRVLCSRVIFWVIRSWRAQTPSPSFIKRVLQKIVKTLTPEEIKKLNNYYLKFCTKHKDSNTGKVTSFFWRMSQNKTYIFNANQLFPVADIYFEGHLFRIVNNPDYYLKKLYGDYLTLPPAEKRTNHNKGVVDLGKYA